MSDRRTFIACARPFPVTFTVPGSAAGNNGTVTITAEPDISSTGGCRWRAATTTLIRIGDEVFEADVAVTVRIKGSNKWG